MSFLNRLRSLFGGGASNGESEPGAGADQSAVGVEGEMISCHDALRLVHDYLDGELDHVPAEQVRAHFDVCQQCYPHLRLENAFRDALRRASTRQTAPEELRTKVLELLSETDA